MYKSEGLGFCLEGRNESADDLEQMLAKCIWRDKASLPDHLLVTRWNGFGVMGRTTYFLFFVPTGADSKFYTTQEQEDHCRLQPLIGNWADKLKAATSDRFEDLYTDEPAILLNSQSIILFYSRYRFESGSVPQTGEIDFPVRIVESPFMSEYEFRTKMSLSEQGIYSLEISDALSKVVPGFMDDR